MAKPRIGLISCAVCGWTYEVDLNKVESGELRPEEPVRIIEKHLKEEHNAEPTTAMRKKPRLIN
jgi:hypothetical protein